MIWFRNATAIVVLVGGCGPGSRTDQRTPPADQADQTNSAADRKRECVDTLTATAEPRTHTLIRSVCAEWVERQIPGVAIAIVEPGRPPIQFELGVRCIGEPTKVESTTAFRIGSVSKPVTAALALGLVDAGQLALTDQATLVPGFVGQAELPTPRLDGLLRHRSGLGEIEPAILVELDGAWLTALTRSPAAGSPGEYHYSNAGFSLIGAWIEQASGQRYGDLVVDRIPGLTGDASIDRAACGHLTRSEKLQAVRVADDLAFMPGDPSWMIPAGGLLGSATELAQFALAIGTERLPGSAAMLELGEPIPAAQVCAGHVDERYGLGLRSWQHSSQTRIYGHSGNTASFSAELLFVPGRRAIVILANRGIELPASLAAAEQLLVSTDPPGM